MVTTVRSTYALTYVGQYVARGLQLASSPAKPAQTTRHHRGCSLLQVWLCVARANTHDATYCTVSVLDTAVGRSLPMPCRPLEIAPAMRSGEAFDETFDISKGSCIYSTDNANLTGTVKASWCNQWALPMLFALLSLAIVVPVLCSYCYYGQG